MSRLTALPTQTLRPLRGRVRRWSVESQLGSRRNAMTASTVLAARRAERDDVEAYLHADVPRRRTTDPVTAHA